VISGQKGTIQAAPPYQSKARRMARLVQSTAMLWLRHPLVRTRSRRCVLLAGTTRPSLLGLMWGSRDALSILVAVVTDLSGLCGPATFGRVQEPLRASKRGQLVYWEKQLGGSVLCKAVTSP